MAKGQTLQDPFLNILRKEKVPVSIYLVNGIKLQGQVDSFDQFVVLLKNSVNQMVYTSMRFRLWCRRVMFVFHYRMTRVEIATTRFSCRWPVLEVVFV